MKDNKPKSNQDLRKIESGKEKKDQVIENKAEEIKSTILDKPKEAWESGIQVLEKIDVIIPMKLLMVCNHISDKVRNDEFSILTNIFERNLNTLTLSKGFYVPKQRVTETSIDYLPDDYKFNTVIHRHPDNMNSFSSTDRNFINQNFELSILYTRADGFVQGIFNVMHDDYLIQLPIVIYIDYGIEDIDISNIERESLFESFTKDRKRRQRHERGVWDVSRPPVESLELFPEERKDEKLLFEEKLDYDLLRTYLLDEVNESIENLDYRVTSIEDRLLYGGASMASNEHPF